MTENRVNEATVRKSTHSGVQNDCVEAGSGDACVGIRDTKHREGGFVVVSPAAWESFLATRF